MLLRIFVIVVLAILFTQLILPILVYLLILLFVAIFGQ